MIATDFTVSHNTGGVKRIIALEEFGSPNYTAKATYRFVIGTYRSARVLIL